MSVVGQKEKLTQQRIVKLFRDTLKYRHLGNWEERENNRNFETEILTSWLKNRGVEFTRDIKDEGFGLTTMFKMPGGIEVQLYQPLYQK